MQTAVTRAMGSRREQGRSRNEPRVPCSPGQRPPLDAAVARPDSGRGAWGHRLAVAVLLAEAKAVVELDAGIVLAEDLQVGQRRIRMLGEHRSDQGFAN